MKRERKDTKGERRNEAKVQRKEGKSKKRKRKLCTLQQQYILRN
jgi:hypothetical protein